jgi:hypothetical protein
LVGEIQLAFQSGEFVDHDGAADGVEHPGDHHLTIERG